MKKSLSLVVAIALVFSLLTPAMAFAATPQETSAGAQLQKYNVLRGDKSGNLNLDEKLSRQDMIVLLSRLMGAEAEAEAYGNTHGFTDVTDPYYNGFISWAKDEGLTQGIGNGLFGYGDELILHQLLQFQLRALGYGEVDWYDVPAKAVELGLVAEGADMEATVSRGQMAVVTVTALNTTVNGTNITLGAKLGIADFIKEAAIASFKAVGAKKLAVDFTAAVDADKAEISLKRGTSTVTVNDIAWSNDNKTATIEIASRLIEGEYTVTVKGVAEEDLVATANVENEKVASIEILSDVAPIARVSSTDADGNDILVDDNTKVSVNYVVKNQYGEDVSSTYVPSPTVSGGTVLTNSNGTLTIEKNTGGFNVNDILVVTLVYASPGSQASVSKELRVGFSAKASEVEIKELYNEDKDAVLSEDTSDDDAKKFKLIVEARDQYNNVITDTNVLEHDLMVTVAGANILELVGNAGNSTTATFEEVTIDGVKKTALSIEKTKSKGTATVTLFARYTGNSHAFAITVAEGLTFDQVILGGVAGIVAAGEDVFVPITVIDTKGNTITDAKRLNDGLGQTNALGTNKLTVQVSNVPAANVSIEEKDGQPHVKFKANSAGYYTVSAFTENHKNDFTTVDVKAAAVPRVIVGLKDVNTLIFDTDDITLNRKNIIVEDNYGRIMPEGQLHDALAGGKGRGNYSIKFKEIDTNSYLDVSGAVYDAVTGETEITILADSKGTKRITLELVDEGDPTLHTTPITVSGSQYNVTFRTVVIDEIESITIEEVATLYAAKGNHAAYKKEVKVIGKTKDGKSVEVPSRYYNLIAADSRISVTEGNKLHVNDRDIVSGNNAEGTVSLQAVILATGVNAEQSVKVTNVDPRVDSIAIRNTDGDAKSELELTGSTFDINSFNVLVKDQYDVAATIAAHATAGYKATAADGTELPVISVTFSNIKDADDTTALTVNNNGKANASISNAAAGDEFTVTIKIGSVSTSAKVKVK